MLQHLYTKKKFSKLGKGEMTKDYVHVLILNEMRKKYNTLKIL